MADVPNGSSVIPIQIAGHDPNPVLLFFLSLPFVAHLLMLGPPLPHPDDPHRSRIGIGEAHRGHIPNLDLASISFHHLSWPLPFGQRQCLLMSFVTFLL